MLGCLLRIGNHSKPAHHIMVAIFVVKIEEVFWPSWLNVVNPFIHGMAAIAGSGASKDLTAIIADRYQAVPG